MNKILRINEVMAVTGLKRGSIYKGILAETFPKQIKLGERASGWLESEVQGWINEKAAEREAA